MKMFALCVLLLSGPLLSAFAETTVETPGQIIIKAREATKNSRPAEAVSLLLPIEDVCAGNVAFQNTLGTAFFKWAQAETAGPARNEHLLGAIKAFQRSLTLKPKSASVLFALGRSFQLLERYGDAEQALREVTALESNSPLYLSSLGNLYAEQKKWSEAEPLFRATVALSPDLAGYRNELGISLFRQEKWRAAEIEFRHAMFLDGTRAEYALNVGAALLKQGKPADARSFVQEARRLGQTKHWAITELGLDKVDAPSVRLFVERPVIEVDLATLTQKARDAHNAQNWGEAEKLYTQLIERQPDDPDHFTSRGIVRNRRQELQLAIDDFTAAEVLHRLKDSEPGILATAIVYRAELFLDLNEPKRALAEANSAAQVDPANPHAYYLCAKAWYAIGDYDRAMEWLKAAQKRLSALKAGFTPAGAVKNAQGQVQPDLKAETDSVFNTAEIALKEHRHADAISGYSRVLELKPMTFNAWLRRADAYDEKNDYTRATADYTTMISMGLSYHLTPEDCSRVVVYRGEVYEKQGRFAAARRDFLFALKLTPDSPVALKARERIEQTLRR